MKGSQYKLDPIEIWRDIFWTAAQVSRPTMFSEIAGNTSKNDNLNNLTPSLTT
jgi:hypothetical protein